MDSTNILYLVIFVICLVISGFFSSAETAFMSLSKLKVKHLVSTQRKGAVPLEKIISEPGKFLSAILLGNNLVNVAAAALATLMAISFVGEAWGVLVATVCVTILVLILGEVIPKTFAAHNAERVALLYTRPIGFIIWILYPFVYVLNRIGVGFTRMVAEPDQNQTVVSEEEIRTAITVGEAEGVWEEAEAEMIHKVFEFADRPVKEVMTPRTEIIWLEYGITIASFFEIYKQYSHSRFPVYKGTTDNVVGVLLIKDVLKAQADNVITTESHIDDLLRPAYFTPELKHLGTLLSEMKDNHYNMVVIVDEFGGVAGMITIEEIVEEIVGGIRDELAEEERDIVPIDANTFEVDGTLRIEEANEELKLSLPEGDYETMAGFVLSHLGRIPRQGERFIFRNLKLAILEMRGMKIERILITKEEDATPES
jgi:putative hemolysin